MGILRADQQVDTAVAGYLVYRPFTSSTMPIYGIELPNTYKALLIDCDLEGVCIATDTEISPPFTVATKCRDPASPAPTPAPQPEPTEPVVVIADDEGRNPENVGIEVEIDEAEVVPPPRVRLDSLLDIVVAVVDRKVYV